MRKLALWEAKHPKTVFMAALLLLIPALIGFVCTRVNYDVLSYLPDDLPAVQGEQILDDVFHSAGISIVVLEDAMAKDASALKQEIGQIEGVSSVLWIDTIADISVPADILPDRIRQIFYSADGSDTMMLVQYEPVEDPDDTLKCC